MIRNGNDIIVRNKEKVLRHRSSPIFTDNYSCRFMNGYGITVTVADVRYGYETGHAYRRI